MKNKIYLYREIFPGKDAKAFSAEALARGIALFREKTGEDPGRVIREKSGKPVFTGGAHYLSVSHTGEAFLAAFAKIPVGIDGETRSARDTDRIKRRFFTESEQREDFLAVFTAKEAVSKISGAGIAAFGRIKVTPGEARAAYEGTEYALWYREDGGALLCLATESAAGEVEKIWI